MEFTKPATPCCSLSLPAPSWQSPVLKLRKSRSLICFSPPRRVPESTLRNCLRRGESLARARRALVDAPVWIWNRSTQPPSWSRSARLSIALPVGSSTSAAALRRLRARRVQLGDRPSRHEIRHEVGLRDERVVARQLERRLRIERADDARLHADVRAARLLHAIERADVDARVEVRRAEEGDASRLHLELALHHAEIERVRAAVGAQRAAQREPVHADRSRVPRPSADRRRLALVARARHVERSAELDVRFRRPQPHLVAEVHRHAVEAEILHEPRRRLRHQRAVAHVGRVEQLGELLLREVLEALVDQLGDVDRPAVDDQRAAESRVAPRCRGASARSRRSRRRAARARACPPRAAPRASRRRSMRGFLSSRNTTEPRTDAVPPLAGLVQRSCSIVSESLRGSTLSRMSMLAKRRPTPGISIVPFADRREAADVRTLRLTAHRQIEREPARGVLQLGRQRLDQREVHAVGVDAAAQRVAGRLAPRTA